MKRLLMFFIPAALIGVGCKPAGSDNAGLFIPGIYVSQELTSIGWIRDTFTIRKSTGRLYLVTHHTILVVKNGKNFNPVNRYREEWSAIYDHGQDALLGTDPDHDLYFYPTANKLYIGNMVYSKIE